MTDHTLAPLPEDTESVPSSPPDAGAASSPSTEVDAQSARQLNFGAGALGVGLLAGIAIGVLGTLLVPAALSSASSAFSASPLEAAIEECELDDNAWVSLGDDGQSLSMQSEGEEGLGAKYADLSCVFTELNVSDSIMTRIGSTRALDGRQTGDWKGFTASWGYHPDSGLDIVIDLVSS